MQFVDRVEVKIKAGNGGNGVIAWLRDATTEYGGPAGGDGGSGSNIYIIADNNYNSLFHIRFQKIIEGKDGGNGGNKCMNGRAAEDIFVRVPPGTLIIDRKNKEIIADLKDNGQFYLICVGGTGGRGNYRFLSSRNKAPEYYERGDKGEEKEIILELKMLADVGLIGKPNAGKSTLISMVTKARPKIANYPFTTVIPVLGIVNIDKENSFLMADLPGLIEGASEGVGLGFEFLRHVERCKVLVHLISMDPNDNENPKQAYEMINKEISLYHKDIIKKPMIIVATKMDLEGSEERANQFQKLIDKKVLFLNNNDIESIKNLTKEISYVLQKMSSVPTEIIDNKEIPRLYSYNPEPEDPIVVDRMDSNRWRVKSKRLDYWIWKIPLTNKDNLLRFHQIEEKIGVLTKLKDAGAKYGDKYFIGSSEFSFLD